MHFDASLMLAGLIVGFVVGMTGMGGGALMTPILVLILGINPSAAVASDLVASLVMKPVGAGVHARRGTVNYRLVLWLCIGSVPAAFVGVLAVQALGDGEQVQEVIKYALGVALIMAASTMILKSVVDKKRKVHLHGQRTSVADISVKPVPTLVVGALGGIIVGMTSVGSGSLIIVMLLLLYPAITAAQLVGTDLMQAIPLVAAASLGHILFGDFQLGLTTSLLIGAIPAVYVGARVSSRAPDAVVRPALVAVLVLSSLKLLGASNVLLMEVLGAFLVGVVVYVGVRWARRGAEASPALAE